MPAISWRLTSHRLARGLDALRRLVRPAAQVDVLRRDVHVQRPGAGFVLLDQHLGPRRERPGGVGPCRTDTSEIILAMTAQIPIRADPVVTVEGRWCAVEAAFVPRVEGEIDLAFFAAAGLGGAGAAGVVE